MKQKKYKIGTRLYIGTRVAFPEMKTERSTFIGTRVAFAGRRNV